MNNLKDFRSQTIRRSGKDLVKHMKEFNLDLKISLGIWYFTPGGGRFHERYVPEKTIAERLEIAAEMSKFGVTGIEAHYPFEANEENLHLYKKCEKESGVKLISAGPWIFYSKDFEFGSFSNPIKSKRDKAIDENINFRDKDERAISITACSVSEYCQPLHHEFLWRGF